MGKTATTGTYTSVSASWTQPGSCSGGDQYAAFWVGLDGYSSSSVEQTGSEVDCIGRTEDSVSSLSSAENFSATCLRSN